MFSRLGEIAALARIASWRALDREFWPSLAELDRRSADSIEAVDTAEYQSSVSSLLTRGALHLTPERGAAGYVEFDMDNQWQTSLFLCSAYRLEDAQDDDWAADYFEVLEGPKFHMFGALYDAAFDGSPEVGLRTLYLIARTVAAIGRAAEASWSSALPLCAGYHDQSALFRLTKPKTEEA